ncbi:MAG: c-type cytochrome [Pseudomonadota bacterium]
MSHTKLNRNNPVKRLSGLLVFASLSLLLSTASNASDVANGEKLSQTCLGCHGAPGLRNPGPVYAIPMVGGQHPSYIVSALKAYKDKSRDHGTMQAQGANLTDENMADIAAFFGAMDGNSRPSRVDAARAKRGQEKAAVCAACHGANGDGDNHEYPKLAGQYESYIVQALKDYRSGARNNAVMSGFAATLSIEDIRDLSAWFASQQGGLSAPQSKIFK